VVAVAAEELAWVIRAAVAAAELGSWCAARGLSSTTAASRRAAALERRARWLILVAEVAEAEALCF
jgi:hypothetical protein